MFLISQLQWPEDSRESMQGMLAHQESREDTSSLDTYTTGSFSVFAVMAAASVSHSFLDTDDQHLFLDQNDQYPSHDTANTASISAAQLTPLSAAHEMAQSAWKSAPGDTRELLELNVNQ